MKIAQLPNVLYDYEFKFKNKPNFSSKTTMFCEKKKRRYYLSIYHKFDFDTEGGEGYLASGLGSNADAAKCESICGKPVKKGKIDGFDCDLFQVQTDFGVRKIEVIYNPNKEEYTRYRLMTIR